MHGQAKKRECMFWIGRQKKTHVYRIGQGRLKSFTWILIHKKTIKIELTKNVEELKMFHGAVGTERNKKSCIQREEVWRQQILELHVIWLFDWMPEWNGDGDLNFC